MAEARAGKRAAARRLVAWGLAAAVVAGCAPATRAPVAERGAAESRPPAAAAKAPPKEQDWRPRTTPSGKATPSTASPETTRQQVVRLDREPESALSATVERALVERLQAVGAEAEAFLVSDYGYGAASPRVFEALSAVARERGAFVAVDSRYDLLRFGGVTAATPNEPEVEALTGTELTDETAVEKAGRQVLEQLDARLLLVTRGSRGMAVFEGEGPVTFLPIHGSDQIADVTGAGETVISAFTVALAAGAAAVDAAWLANVAGGVVVMKRGTATVSPGELRAALSTDGALSHA